MDSKETARARTTRPKRRRRGSPARKDECTSRTARTTTRPTSRATCSSRLTSESREAPSRAHQSEGHVHCRGEGRPRGALFIACSTSSSASSSASACSRRSSSSASSAAARRATTATSPPPLLERRLARAASAAAGRARSPPGSRTARAAPSPAARTRAAAAGRAPGARRARAPRQERHGHDPLRHVAGLLGDLPRVPRILRQVLDHERLPGDERPAGDAGARRDPRADQPCSSSPATASKTSSSASSSSRKIDERWAEKIARATSTIDRSSEP